MVNRAKELSESNGKEHLAGVLIDIEKRLISELKREAKESTHDGTLGGNCEQLWIELLRDYLPVRYRVDNAFVIDSTGKTSDQLDIVIYDAQYTPAMYGHDRVPYLPREAIYAVLEAKPAVTKQHLEYAGKKAESVQRLHCSSAPIVNAGKTFPAREPFCLLAGLVAQKASWEDGLQSQRFLDNLPSDELQRLDFVITAESGFYDGRDFESPDVLYGEGSLMRGLFRLLQALQQLGTVPAIDWSLYEKVLQK